MEEQMGKVWDDVTKLCQDLQHVRTGVIVEYPVAMLDEVDFYIGQVAACLKVASQQIKKLDFLLLEIPEND